MTPKNEQTLAGFCAEMMGVYYEAWFSDEPRAAGPERDGDAFHLLGHAGMLSRLTRDPEITLMLNDEPPEVRFELVAAAMRALDTAQWTAALTDLDDSEESQTLLEEAVLFRDTLGLVWDLANMLTLDAAPGETPELEELMRLARARIQELDKKFKSVDKLQLMQALHVLDGVRDCVWDDVAEECWWLRDPRPLIEKHMAACEKPVLDALKLSRTSALANYWRNCRKCWESVAQSPEPVLQPFAAAAKSSPSLPPMRCVGSPETVVSVKYGKEGLHIRLDVDGRPPEWINGAKLEFSNAAGAECGAVPFDPHGRAVMPPETFDALETGGRLSVVDSNGAQLFEVSPIPGKDGAPS